MEDIVQDAPERAPGGGGAGAAIAAVALAFVVGGCFSLVGQLFMLGAGALLGAESPLVGPLTLVLMGLLGMALCIPGIYQKLMGPGGFGTIMPFCGLAVACALEYCQAKGKTGSAGAGAWAAAKLVIYVAGIGCIFAACAAAIMTFGMA